MIYLEVKCKFVYFDVQKAVCNGVAFNIKSKAILNVTRFGNVVLCVDDVTQVSNLRMK